MPSSWTGVEVGGALLPGHGHATLRLRVLLRPSAAPLAVRLESAGTAYVLTVDGKPVAANGQVGTSPQTHRAEFRSGVFDLPTIGAESEWVLAVSNYNYRKGGPWSPLRLGPTRQLHRHRDWDLMVQLFAIGSLTVMGVYHLVLFAFRRRDKSTLWFGLFCLAVAARQASTGERLLMQLDIGFPWAALIRVEFISYFVAVFLGPLFLHTLYPAELARRFTSLAAIVGLAAALIALVAPPPISSYLIPPYQTWTVLLAAYCVWCLLLAVRRKREGAWVFLAGFAILVVAVISDILYSVEVHRIGYVVSFGLLVFIFSQALLLARRFATAFVTAETLQQGLELKVLERTQELAEKNEHLERTIGDLQTTQSQLKQVGLPIRIGTEHHVFPYSDILYLSAHGKKTVIHTRTTQHEVTRALKDIEPLLSTDVFLRIHRQCVVNVAYVSQIAHIGSGGYIAILRDEAGTTLPVSRYQAQTLKERLGMAIA
jgi:DNA-binding LytR/AlgR family response regulator